MVHFDEINKLLDLIDLYAQEYFEVVQTARSARLFRNNNQSIGLAIYAYQIKSKWESTQWELLVLEEKYLEQNWSKIRKSYETAKK